MIKTHPVKTTKEQAEKTYARMRDNLSIARERLSRPLTLMEKIILGHLEDPKTQPLKPGVSFLSLRPDRVAMQDATAQMALLQFMSSGKNATSVPTTVHCDHLLLGRFGAKKDLALAQTANKEIYDFLFTCSQKYGIGFWGPGAGIIHQVVLENYAFPGGMMIGTDSHTPNAGGLAMIACGVGGGDAVDVMAGFPWEVKYPKKIGVHLKGAMTGWTAPKDIILKLLEILTVKGGTNKIVEYFGQGTSTISCTGKGTICNMGAELGATTSIFPYDEAMSLYLTATQREELAALANANTDLLTADKEVWENPEKFFDEIIEIELTTLEPYIVGPHSPDLARPISKLKEDAEKNNYEMNISASLIGSCTNSSYEDISRAADLAEQALKANVDLKTPLYVSPGSEQIYETVKRDGQLDSLIKLGATIFTNSCGPCIGQWHREGMENGKTNTIVSSFNRNFPGRNDGNRATLSFLASPEIALALSLAGTLAFNPLRDELKGTKGKSFRFEEPKKALPIPPKGFIPARDGYKEPDRTKANSIEVKIDPNSSRLQLLEPFRAWKKEDFQKLPLLLKAKGKCTTDHISPAGKWLRFRGHLDNISDNMFSGAINAFHKEVGKVKDIFTGSLDSASKVARNYKSKNLFWVVVGDENYGEGSSREHAAMCPRFLGAAIVIARSFARIHETNLKKQGVLPFTFINKNNYEKIQEGDTFSFEDLKNLAPAKENKSVFIKITHQDSSEETIELRHTLSAEQIQWIHEGSSLNYLNKKNKSTKF